MKFKRRLKTEKGLLDLTPLINVFFLLFIFFLFIHFISSSSSICQILAECSSPSDSMTMAVRSAPDNERMSSLTEALRARDIVRYTG